MHIRLTVACVKAFCIMLIYNFNGFTLHKKTDVVKHVH